MSRITKGIVFFALIGIISCTEDRYFEANNDFTDRLWPMNEKVSFTFSIDDADAMYQLYANVRNDMEYPYRNLYIHYTLEDSTGHVIEKKLQDIQLFEGKTGAPFGDKVSNIYSHQILLEDSVLFPSKGDFTVSYKQYMRTDSLEGIYSTGLRIEIVSNSAE